MSRTKKRIVSLVALVMLTASLVGCDGGKIQNPEVQTSEDYYDYFDTVCTIYDYSGDEDFTERCRAIEDIIAKYDRLLDIYDEHEGVVNLATLNRTAGEGSALVSAELLDFLLYGKQIYELTGGEVNIAMGAVLSIWHEHRNSLKTLPSETALKTAALHTHIDDLILDEASCSVRFADPEMSLDAGALGKGYVAARIREYLESEGVSGYVVNLGGNLLTVGEKPNGDGWLTGVKSPTEYGKYAKKFTLRDASAVTSGSYERYFVVDGERYHHIIDKDTLMPARGFDSVTVITSDDALADALSTGLFCMSYEQCVALLDTIDGVSVIWVTESGEVLTYGKIG